jgi:hypothetical protein
MKFTVDVGGKERSIPGYMQDGLEHYVEHGFKPGDFLTAVLENRLSQAVWHADSCNQRRLVDYVFVIFNNAPADCWGSPEKVKSWIERGGLAGIRGCRHEWARPSEVYDRSYCVLCGADGDA